MTPTVRIARIFGIDVRLHVTFVALVGLVLAWAVLPGSGVRPVTLLALGALFLLAALHELGHALVARRLGVEVQDILFLPILLMVRLRLPEKARTELAVAAAGPAVNLLIAAVLVVTAPVLGIPAANLVAWPATSFLALVFWVNLLMGTVNLLPAFPMDGGRCLRALLAMRMDYATATSQAVRAGLVVVLVAGTAGFLATGSIVIPVAAVFLLYLGQRELGAVRERARRRELARMRAELAAADVAGEGGPTVSRYGDFRRLEDPRFREMFERYRNRIEQIRDSAR